MLEKKYISAGVIAGCALLVSGTACASNHPIKITVWDAMGGMYGKELKKLTHEFNQSQSKYKVVTSYKGSYSQTLNSVIAAYRSHNQPDIVQVYDMGTATMLNAKNVIIPVYKLMKQAGIKFSSNEFIPAVRSYYENNNGKLLSLPFNSSTPVLFYNKSDFKKAGLNPSNPPKTWDQLYKDAKKLKQSGISCAFTTTYPTWTQLENFAAWQNIPFANHDDGFNGFATKLKLDSKPFVQHISLLGKMAKKGLFDYGGRGYKASSLFKSGHCAMTTDSSASYNVYHSAKFPVGEGPLPYNSNIVNKPQNTVIGGASFWALNGKPKSHLKGVAEYLNFLSSVKSQIQWTDKTGYVPTTKAAYQKKKQQGFYKQHPGTYVPIRELSKNKPTKYSRGVRLGNLTQIINIINQELESVWSGKQSASTALNKIVSRGDHQLKRFKQSHQ